VNLKIPEKAPIKAFSGSFNSLRACTRKAKKKKQDVIHELHTQSSVK